MENQKVIASKQPAWLFVALTLTTIEQFANQEIVGPYGLTAASFEQAVKALGNNYRVVRVGFVTAIIPHTPVSPAQITRTLRP